MIYFHDTTNQQIYAFEPDINVERDEVTGQYVFKDKLDQVLNLPVTLKPCDAPAAPSSQIENRRFSSLQFFERFTIDEQRLVAGATSSNVDIKLWYDKLMAADFVDIDDPRTEVGIDALIAAELIEASRKGALLQPEFITL